MLDNPGWWPSLMKAKASYELGLLPGPGAMGQQNALFSDIMYWLETYLERYGKIAADRATNKVPLVDAQASFH